MYLSDGEKLITTWLQSYGPLLKTQVIKLLNCDIEKVRSHGYPNTLFRQLRAKNLICDVNTSYIGVYKYEQPDEKMIRAMWVFLYFINDVEFNNHHAGPHPAQILFLKDCCEYIVMTVTDGLEHEILLLDRDSRNRKYIFVVSSFAKESDIKRYLPNAPCVLATLTYDGVSSEPIVQFKVPVREGETVD